MNNEWLRDFEVLDFKLSSAISGERFVQRKMSNNDRLTKSQLLNDFCFGKRK